MFRRTTEDHGFTLIEVLIAMVLLTIVVGMVGHGILQAIGTSGSARAGAVSDAALTRFSDAFGSDVASAETDDRAAGQVRDASDLGPAVRTGANIASFDAGGGNVDIDDVVAADGASFTLKADVLDDAAHRVECVTWTARTVNSTFEVVRTVTRTPAAPAAPCSGTTSTSVVLSSPDNPLLNKHPFTYQLQCKACAGTPNKCAVWPVNGTVLGTKLRWIVGVRADIVNVAQQGSAAATSASGTTMSIRSRDTEAYKAALGC